MKLLPDLPELERRSYMRDGRVLEWMPWDWSQQPEPRTLRQWRSLLDMVDGWAWGYVLRIKGDDVVDYQIVRQVMPR